MLGMKPNTMNAGAQTVSPSSGPSTVGEILVVISKINANRTRSVIDIESVWGRPGGAFSLERAFHSCAKEYREFLL